MVVKHFRGAECDIDHCLVVADFREAMPIHKKSSPKFFCGTIQCVEAN
jgi:hypothetical protein